MVPEAQLERTERGLVPLGEGWFVLNAREARWRYEEGRSAICEFEGDQEGELDFHQLGGGYTVDEVALRHGAGVEKETTRPEDAYAGLTRRGYTRYREGWLPE